jgi:hypothetical protein
LGTDLAFIASYYGIFFMKDYDAISETVFHYFEGYQTKDRERLEKAFVVNIANLMGY